MLKQICHYITICKKWLLLCFIICLFELGLCSLNQLYAKDLNKWDIGFGVACISDNNTSGAVLGEYKIRNGDAGGHIYNIFLG